MSEATRVLLKGKSLGCNQIGIYKYIQGVDEEGARSQRIQNL